MFGGKWLPVSTWILNWEAAAGGCNVTIIIFQTQQLFIELEHISAYRCQDEQTLNKYLKGWVQSSTIWHLTNRGTCTIAEEQQYLYPSIMSMKYQLIRYEISGGWNEGDCENHPGVTVCTLTHFIALKNVPQTPLVFLNMPTSCKQKGKDWVLDKDWPFSSPSHLPFVYLPGLHNRLRHLVFWNLSNCFKRTLDL